MDAKPRERAFTLIELLVVIAIIGTLIGILLPAIGSARTSAKATVEIAGMRQLMLAYQMYSDDNNDRLMIGFPSDDHWSTMVDRRQDPRDASGDPVGKLIGRRYPYRIMPYLEYNFDGIYLDKRVVESLAESQESPSDSLLAHRMRYVASLYPSFGLNSYFVGGGAPGDSIPFSNAGKRIFGEFHLKSLYQAQRTSGVMVFSSARSLAEPAYLPGYGVLEGGFGIRPPYLYSTSGRQWEESYSENSQSPASNAGNVSLRFAGRGAAGFLDGHATLEGFEAFQDMRMWADQADSADWVIEARLP